MAQLYTHGSRYQLGRWIANHPAELQEHVFEASPSLASFATGDLQWIAPTGPTDPRELRDQFWEEIGLARPTPQSADWWPERGPVWDAVARVPGPNGQAGGVVVEAKGRLNELSAGGCKAEGPSLEKIRNALLDVQASLGIAPNLGWLRAYYQMANRLAFLWFARLRGDEQPLWLVWVYFLGEHYPTATGVSVGPEDPEAWAPVIAEAHTELGLPETHELSVFEATVFLPALEPPEGSPA
jgi:hypothetical protein